MKHWPKCLGCLFESEKRNSELGTTEVGNEHNENCNKCRTRLEFMEELNQKEGII